MGTAPKFRFGAEGIASAPPSVSWWPQLQPPAARATNSAATLEERSMVTSAKSGTGEVPRSPAGSQASPSPLPAFLFAFRAGCRGVRLTGDGSGAAREARESAGGAGLLRLQ